MILLLSNNTFSLNVTKFTSNSYLHQNINVESTRHFFFSLWISRSSIIGWRLRGGRWEAEKEANLCGIDQKMYSFNILLTRLCISVSAKASKKGCTGGSQCECGANSWAVTTPQWAAEKEEATRAPGALRRLHAQEPAWERQGIHHGKGDGASGPAHKSRAIPPEHEPLQCPLRNS